MGGNSGQGEQHVQRREGTEDLEQQPLRPPLLSPLSSSLSTDASSVGQGPPMAGEMV